MPHVATPRPERALTAAQRSALLALRHDGETPAAEVARITGMKPNGVALAIQGLERRGFVVRHDTDPPSWTLSFSGHALAGRLAGRATR